MRRSRRSRAAAGLALSVAVAGVAASAASAVPSEATQEAPVEVEPSLAEPGGVSLDRAALLAAVEARNPGLAAALAARRAAKARLPAAGALPDPMVRGGVAPASAFEDVRFGYEAAVEQELPARGVRGAQREAARAAVEQATGSYEVARFDLLLEASRLYDAYYLNGRAQAINDEQARLFEERERAALARYAAGLGTQQEALQAASELAHLEHRRVVLASEEATLRARLNALLRRPIDAPLPPPPLQLEVPAPDQLIRGYEDGASELADLAQRFRPSLAVAGAEVAGLEAELELAEAERRPRASPTASYNSMWDDREHRLMVGVDLELPWRRRPIEAGIAAAQAELDAARERRDAAALEAAEEAAASYYRVREAGHLLTVYSDLLLPAARDEAASVRAGLESGRASFLELLEAERNVRAVELGQAEELAAYATALAELAWSVGLPLERLAGTAQKGEGGMAHGEDDESEGEEEQDQELDEDEKDDDDEGVVP